MEQNYFKITKPKLLLYTALLLILISFVAHFMSKASKPLNSTEHGTFIIVFLTEKPMMIEMSKSKNILYMPKKASKFKKSATNKEKSKKVLTDMNIISERYVYVIPKEQDRQAVWQNIKSTMLYKRYNPMIFAKNFYQFAVLKFQKKTNLSWYDFVLISIRKADVQPSDFIIKQSITDEISETNADKPMLVEVLNASGKKNMAVNLTKYLRKLNDENIIRVDVLRYSNYHKKEKNTKIISHTDKVDDLKKISKELNLTGTEIFHKPAGSIPSDAKIIIGEDFTIPEN